MAVVVAAVPVVRWANVVVFSYNRTVVPALYHHKLVPALQASYSGNEVDFHES